MRNPVVTFLYCQACSNKFLLDDMVVEIPVSDIPGGIPYVCQESGKVKMPPDLPRRRLFKCPKCGRGVASKILTIVNKEPRIVSSRNNYTNPLDPRS